MPTSRQFVAVRFRPGDRRTYTFHHDGEPVAVGDRVVVSTNKGPQTVTVAELSSEAPSFATKAIVGKAPAKEESASAPVRLGDSIGF